MATKAPRASSERSSEYTVTEVYLTLLIEASLLANFNTLPYRLYMSSQSWRFDRVDTLLKNPPGARNACKAPRLCDYHEGKRASSDVSS